MTIGDPKSSTACKGDNRSCAVTKRAPHFVALGKCFGAAKLLSSIKFVRHYSVRNLKVGEMTEKINLGRLCEYLVKVVVEAKTGWIVENINDTQMNHPRTDLLVLNPVTGDKYEISVKAKQGNTWPRVRGIAASNEYIVFCSLSPDSDPEFFVLNNDQWGELLKELIQTRSEGAGIINGSIEWHWEEGGKKKHFKGTAIKRDELLQYKDNWSVLPGIKD